MISNCGHDERGAYSGGQAGDQGGEYIVREWYNRPWYCTLRHPNKEFSELVANMAIAAANNDMIGYDQGQRTTFWDELQKVNYDPAAITVPCETDCSASSCSIIRGAAMRMGIKELQDLPITSTHYMRAALTQRGYQLFTDSQHTTSDAFNERGDVLLKDDAHVAIDVGDGQLNGYSSSGGMGGGSNINIDFERTSPYVVGVPDNIATFDIESMKQHQISGVMLSAGSLYTSGHLKKNDYVNPNLKSQVQCCKDAMFPWGLCAEVRAHTVAEAEAECERLYYVVSAYPPRLSLWLHVNTGRSKQETERILDYYYEQMVKWGFKHTAGIYVDKDEMKKLDWNKYQDMFYLWYKNHDVDLESFIGTLINPVLFAIDYEGRKTPLEQVLAMASGMMSASSPTSGADANTVLGRAQAQLGKPYIWGGSSEQGFDCSGFVSYCLTGKYGHFWCTSDYNGWPTTTDPQPGDVWVRETGNPRQSHCGIYMGNGKMIHCGGNPAGGGSCVNIRSARTDGKYVKYQGQQG